MAGERTVRTRRRRQPERATFDGGAPRRFGWLERDGGDRDHVAARDCLTAATRKCRMYCAPEYSDTTVDNTSNHHPAL